MAKKYKLLLLILLTVVAAILIYNGNRTRFFVSEGTYVMVSDEEAQLKPLIHFYKEESKIRFVFAADKRISFAHTGHVEQRGRKIRCVSKDNTWTFEMQDKDTLCFLEQDSSEFPLGETHLPDGATFQLEE